MINEALDYISGAGGEADRIQVKLEVICQRSFLVGGLEP